MKKDIKKLFGLKIKEYRTKRGLKQCKLSELVDVDPKTISVIESGKNFPSPKLIYKLAVALKVETKDLIDFNHLQEEKNLKTEIISMVNKLSKENLSILYKITKSFLD